ncbi:VRR-NUC domain-containing protein [Grimontia marina]|uniref:VRR-NUC domain protein n=1 Tax=Grimontia marina TaxID=646534 RepID=A0A128EZJ0_9GAMM|nr:VRR-NUC domain-containing protein [Grimontia marina]CZF79685.1 VRR-NUC domain protein [Grimontia marina]
MYDNVFSLEQQLGRIRHRGDGRVQKVRREPEAEECADLVRWARRTTIAGIRVGDFLTHIPNEGKRGKKARADFHRLGGQPGYPDYLLDVARCGYYGLRIEAKAPTGGRITEDQRKWEVRLSGQGYLFAYCYSAEEMKGLIADYLKGHIEGPDSGGTAA